MQIHEALKVTTDYQTHFRLRESQGRSFAEDLNEKVMLWSIGESLMILVIGIRYYRGMQRREIAWHIGSVWEAVDFISASASVKM